MDKKFFDKPSPETINKMIAAGFSVGIPQKAGWYLVSVRSNDIEERYYVLQLWFNPDAVFKWWTGGGYVSSKAEKYTLQNNIRSYCKLPNFNED